MLYEEVQIGCLYKWKHHNSDWHIDDIGQFDNQGRMIKYCHIDPNQEFTVLNKIEFDWRYAIKVILSEKEQIGWLICGNAYYPMEKIVV